MDKTSSPAFTFSSRIKQNSHNTGPGPLTYRNNIQITKPNHPSAVIGKSNRQTFLLKQGPSPGQYDLQPTIRSKSCSGVISRYKEPQVKQSSKKIGPGFYNPEFDKILKKSSVCRFNKSPKSLNRKQNDKSPGPMSYNPNSDTVSVHQPITKFGKSQRKFQLKTNIPGPGQYNTQTIKTYRSQSAFRFTKQLRSDKKQMKQPGRTYKLIQALDYKIESQFDLNLKQNRGFKISLNKQHVEKQIQSKLPGPTSYNSEKIFKWKKQPAFSMPKGDRKNLIQSNMQTPPSTFYSTTYDLKKRASSALISNSRRQSQKQLQRKQTIPGPGYYQKTLQYKQIGSGTKFTIPRSQNDQLKSSRHQKRPDPWTYNIVGALKQKLKYGVLGKSRKQDLSNRKTLPGPGDYNIKQLGKSGIIIGKQKRETIPEKKGMIPGPNCYNIPSTIGYVPSYVKTNKK